MNRKINLNAAALLCTMAMTSLNVYSADAPTDFSGFKSAIENGEDPVDIQDLDSNIQFESKLQFNKDVSISGKKNGAGAFSAKKGTFDQWGAFQVDEGGSLTIKDVNFDDFVRTGDKGVDSVIFSAGDVTIGPNVTFGEDIKTMPKGAGSYPNTATVVIQATKDKTTLNLQSSNEGDVTFETQNGALENTLDVYLFGSNIDMQITGNGGKVVFGNGIGGDQNNTITHSGENEFVLKGNGHIFRGKYIQNNEEGITTFQGKRFFSGESDIQKGTLKWEANDDTSRGKLSFGDNTKLTVGDGSSVSALTLSAAKNDSIAQTINMTVNDSSTLTLNGFNGKKSLTLKNKIKGNGKLELSNDDITFDGESGGLESGLTLQTTNSQLTLSNFSNDESTLNVIANATNSNLDLNINNYEGKIETDITVDGTGIKSVTFSGTNVIDGSESSNAGLDINGAGTVINNSSADTTIKGDLTIGSNTSSESKNLTNQGNAKLTVQGGKFTNGGDVLNNGTISLVNGSNETTGKITGSGSWTISELFENQGNIEISGNIESKSVDNQVAGSIKITGSGNLTVGEGGLTNTSGTVDMSESTGTFKVNGTVTNSNGTIKGQNAQFKSYSDITGNDTILDLSGDLTIEGDDDKASNTLQNTGTVKAKSITVSLGGITNSSNGNITVDNGNGNITVSDGGITNGTGANITAQNINATGDVENQGSIQANGTLTVGGNLTSEDESSTTMKGGSLNNVTMNGGTIKNTGDLTISGEVTGSSGTITHNGGELTLSGDASEYTGTFTQTAGETTVSDDYLFGGVKNIQGGTLTASGSEMYSGSVNLSGGSNFSYTLNGEEGSITNSLLSFGEGGGSANFAGGNANTTYTLSDNITNENLGTVTFKDTKLKLNSENGGEYSYKDFIFDNSTLQLGDADNNEINHFTFGKFTAKNGSKVDLNVKFNEGNILDTDSLTVSEGSTGELALGNIFISDEGNVENGKNYTTQENEGVLRGSGAGVYGLKLSKGTTSGVKGATTAFEYDITVNSDQKGISANVSKIADEHSLYKMDSETTGERFFQFSTRDEGEYHIDQSLNQTLAGTFTVQGKSTNKADSVLSGQLKEKGGELKDEKGSFFNIKDNIVNLTVKNMTIQDADSADRGGSVLHNENEGSKVVLDNLLIQNNSSQDANGGAIYNNGGKGTNPEQSDFTGLYVGNTTFDNNTSTGKGGAIYNDSEGFLYLENVTTTAATEEGKNDIYNVGTAYTNGKNTFNSLFTNEKDITFQGENTLSKFVNSGSGDAKFNGENDVITEFTNSAVASVNSKNAQIDNYTSTTGTLNFKSNNAVLGTVTGDEDSSIINEGNLTLKGNGGSYAGDFSQTTGTFTVEKDATFFSGNSSVVDGVLNWYTKNQPETAVLNVTGGILNVGDNADNQGEIIFKNGSTVTENVTTNIGKGSKLSVEDEGKVTLSNGAWYGDVSLSEGGDLTLNNLNNKTQKGGTLSAQGGKLTLDGNTQLALGEGSIIESAVETKIGKDSQVFLEQGTLTLSNDDSWEGTVFMEENTNGTLTFDGYTKELGTLQASAGSVNFTNNSKIEFGFDEKQNYSGIVKNVKTTIENGSEVILNKGGYLELDDDEETADKWLGKVTLAGGILDYGVKNPESAGELNATEGNLNLLSGSVLNIETPSSVDDKVAVDIQGGSTVDIKNGATFNIDSATNDKWNGLVKNEGGTFNVSGIDNTKGHGGGIQQTEGKTTLTDKANIYISDSDSFITGGDVDIEGESKLSFGMGVQDLNAQNLKMTDASQLSILNGEINSAHANNVNVTGTANFAIDLDPRSKVGDNFDFGTITGTDATLNISDFNFTGGAPIDRYIDFTLFSGDKSGVNFDATKDLKLTPIGYYGLESMGEGKYRAYLGEYNPQVFRGQVATLAAYTQQLIVDDMITNHFILHNERFIDRAKDANKYAADAVFTPYQKTYEEGGLWAKTYVSLNKLDMTRGLSVGSNIWGTIAGADLPAVELNEDWKFIPTGYIGYNAGHQHFNGVSMQQNGGQLGVMGTFIRDEDFITSATIYGGGYTTDMDVAGYNDDTANWFAGTAVKTAYNFHPFKDFIFQPNLLAAYNAFGQQNWGTDFGIMSMNSGMLNGINVAPGANLILTKDTWSIYATIQYMYYINDKVDGKAGNVNLPNVQMDHGYLQYGIGGTKVWKDRLGAYGQVTFRNAGVTGIGFQAGLNYSFDLNFGKLQKKKAEKMPRELSDIYITKISTKKLTK